jgi:hypothetical protein
VIPDLFTRTCRGPKPFINKESMKPDEYYSTDLEAVPETVD